MPARTRHSGSTWFLDTTCLPNSHLHGFNELIDVFTDPTIELLCLNVFSHSSPKMRHWNHGGGSSNKENEPPLGTGAVMSLSVQAGCVSCQERPPAQDGSSIQHPTGSHIALRDENPKHTSHLLDSKMR